MRGDQQLTRCYFMISIDGNKSEDPLSIDKLDQRDNEEKDEPVEQLISIPLGENDLTKIVQIRSLLLELE